MPRQTGIATCWRDWINNGMKWEASNGSPVIPLCRLVFIRFACRAQRVAECGPNQVRKFVSRSYLRRHLNRKVGLIPTRKHDVRHLVEDLRQLLGVVLT